MSNALTPKKGAKLNISRAREVYGIGSPVGNVHLRFDLQYTEQDMTSPTNTQPTDFDQAFLTKTQADEVTTEEFQLISQNTTTTATTRTTNSRSHSNYSNLGQPSASSAPRNSRSKSHLFENCELKVNEPEFMKPHVSTSFEFDNDLDLGQEMLGSDIQSEGKTSSSNELSIQRPPFLDSHKLISSKRILSQLSTALGRRYDHSGTQEESCEEEYHPQTERPQRTSSENAFMEPSLKNRLSLRLEMLEDEVVSQSSDSEPEVMNELPERIPRSLNSGRERSVLATASFSSASESLLVNSEDKENVKIPHFKVATHFQTPKLKPRRNNPMSPINESYLEKINQSLDYSRIKSQDVDEYLHNLPGRLYFTGQGVQQAIQSARDGYGGTSNPGLVGSSSVGQSIKMAYRSGKRLRSSKPLSEETRSLENSLMAENSNYFSKLSIHKTPTLSLDNTFCGDNSHNNSVGMSDGFFPSSSRGTTTAQRLKSRHGQSLSRMTPLIPQGPSHSATASMTTKSISSTRKRSCSPSDGTNEPLNGTLRQLRRGASRAKNGSGSLSGHHSARMTLAAANNVSPLDDESFYYMTSESHYGPGGSMTPTYSKMPATMNNFSRQRKLSGRQFEQSTGLGYQPIPELVSNSSSYVKTDSCFNTNSTPMLKKLDAGLTGGLSYRRKKSLIPQTSRPGSYRAVGGGVPLMNGQLLHQGSLSVQKFTFETSAVYGSTQKDPLGYHATGSATPSSSTLKHQINERLLENLFLVYRKYDLIISADESSVSIHAELEKKYEKYSQVLVQGKSQNILIHIVTSHKSTYTVRYIGIALCLMCVLSSAKFFPTAHREHREKILKLCDKSSPEMTKDLRVLLEDCDIVSYRLFLVRYHSLNEYSVEIIRRVEQVFLDVFRSSQ